MDAFEHLSKQPEHIERLGERVRQLDTLIASTDARLQIISPVMTGLLEERHRLFTLKAFDPEHPDEGGSVIDLDRPLSDQMYPELTNNESFYSEDLGLRGGGVVEFHNEREKYNPKPDDSPEFTQQKEEYRQAILEAAQQFGFIAPSPGESTHPIDQLLQITDSLPEPIEIPIEAAIVPGAAGLSDHLRLWGTLRDIESGVVKTKRIIMATCDRPIRPDEHLKLAQAGFHGGETEFELCQSAIDDIAGGFIDIPEETTFLIELESGSYPARRLFGTILVGGRPVQVDILSAPYDPKRLMPNKEPAKRTNTEETFLAVEKILSASPSTLLIKSHDTWTPAQIVIAEKIFGVDMGKQILGSGPFRSDRVYVRDDGTVDINMAEAVIDEMAKYYKELVNLRATAETKRTELLANMPEMESALLQPVPDMWDLRHKKAGYRELPIGTKHERSSERLVHLADYGIASQAYYSRPNATTGEPVPGVPSELSVRESVAQTLAALNQQLASPQVTEFFGGEVELYVEDAWRSPELQAHLHDTAIPALTRKNEPHLTEAGVRDRRDQIIAWSSFNPQSPSPHATGGAIDVILRYKQSTSNFVEGVNVPMGHHDGDTATHIDPDYFEYHHPTTPEELEAQRNRRAFYAIMTGAAFGIETGFSVNPTEFWHWSRGDQLAAFVSGGLAYYSFPPEAL